MDITSDRDDDAQIDDVRSGWGDTTARQRTTAEVRAQDWALRVGYTPKPPKS